MTRESLQLADVTLGPQIAFILFMAFFVGVAIWTYFVQDKKEYQRISEEILNSDVSIETEDTPLTSKNQNVPAQA